MSSPHVNTATVLDSMIRGRDLIYGSVDRSYALEEFAMGVNLTVRDLDICWGYSYIEPELSANYDKEMTVSIGVTRQSGDLNNVPTNEEGLSLSALLDDGGAEALQNVYAFGSVFLQANTAPAVPSVVPLLLRGGTTGEGTRLLMSRDLTVAEALDALKNGDIPPVTPPAGTTLEIYRFLLDITYFDSMNSYKNRINTYVIDVRKPRGWGGYAEENMGSVLIPSSIANYNNVNSSVEDAEDAVKEIVQTWVELPSWEPDFLHFWQKSGSNIMPERLERYLDEILGIVLLP
jgi:hypothetical protein